MQLLRIAFLSAGAVTMAPAFLSFADTPPVDSEPTTTWECPQADGSSLYTNKEKPGCRAMTLKPLSVVPDLEHMPTIPRPVSAPPAYQLPPPGSPSGTDWQQVPDWAREWRASIASTGSVHDEVCTLYSEWLHLMQKTRGGFFFGSDPSYGGDVTGRNQRGPSYSFYDNARYLALSRLFGTGFVPVGCP